MLENTYIATALFILGFGFLIFIHELGHFLSAKWVGIRCPQFAIGFGPAILAWRKGIGIRVGSTESEYLRKLINEIEPVREGSEPETPEAWEQRLAQLDEQRVEDAHEKLGLGETEYRLNLLPLGGYVKMLGQEDLDATATSQSPKSFNSKSIPARALVISAGVIMNLITGFVFFIPAFLVGVDFPAAEVGMIAPDSPAESAAPIDAPEGTSGGLQQGDRIIAIDDKPIRDMVEVGIAIALAPADVVRDVTVERPGLANPLTFAMTPKPDSRREGLLSIGISPSSTLKLVSVTKDGLLDQNGVTKGMSLTSVNNTQVNRFYELSNAISQTHGQPVTLTFTGKDKTATIQTQPLLAIWDDPERADIIGIQPAVRVTRVIEDNPAAKAGIQDGDIIYRLGGAILPSVPQLRSIVENADGTPLRLSVIRGDDGQQVDLGNITPSQGKIGIQLSPAIHAPYVAQTTDGEQPPLPAGSTVDWVRIQRAMTQPTDGPLVIPYEFEGSTAQYLPTLTEEQRAELVEADWMIPPLGAGFAPLQVALKADSMTEAVGLGISKTGEFMSQTYLTLLRLFQGSVQVQNLRGPVGIVDEGQKVASRGWPYLLFFLGLISINLAVLNFLPLPIVDGGLMIFLLLEGIRGKPVSVKVQQVVTVAGLALLGCLFLFVTFNDIWRLIFT